MPAVLVQAAASHRIDAIYRYTREHWGREQADRYVTGLFEAFGKIETRGVASGLGGVRRRGVCVSIRAAFHLLAKAGQW